MSFLIMFYPYYSYSYSGFNNPEEKNSNPELLNKIIEPTINSVSLNDIDIDDLNINDNKDIECFENDDNKIVCFDKNAINDDGSLFIID